MSEAVKLEPKPVEPKRIASVRFVDSVPFGGAGEAMGVEVGTTAEFVVPARHEADGSPVTIAANQRADGLLLSRRYHDRVRNRATVERVFVPWSNVRGVKYGE